MKKFIVSILAVLYFGLSTGTNIHLHYCMGKLVGSSLWHNDSKVDDKCSNCGMFNKNKKCCKDEHKLLQVEKDQKLNDSFSQKISLAKNQIFPPFYFEYRAVINKTAVKIHLITNAPPESGVIPIYLRNRVFRI